MLDSNILESIYSGLKSSDKNELLDTLKKVQQHLANMGNDERILLADAIMSLFYLDEAEDSGYAEVYDSAGDVLAQMGPGIVDVLIEGMTGAGVHVDYHIAQALSGLGKPAVKALLEKFRDQSNPDVQGLALYALSSIDDPALIEIFDEVIALLESDNFELRDTAAGAVGSMVDCIGGLCLESLAVEEVFEKLIGALSDTHAGTRSKAVKSIGKLAKKEYLSDEQKEKALPIITGILGIDDAHQWDRAFIVRREAEDAYFHLTGEKVSSIGAVSICKMDK